MKKIGLLKIPFFLALSFLTILAIYEWIPLTRLNAGIFDFFQKSSKHLEKEEKTSKKVNQKKLVVAETIYPLTFDPFNCSRPVEQRISSLIFQRLLRMGKSGYDPFLIKDVVEEPGHRKFRFKLKGGVFFSNTNDTKVSKDIPGFKDLKYSIKLIQCDDSRYPDKMFFKEQIDNIIRRGNDEGEIALKLSQEIGDQTYTILAIPLVKNGCFGEELTGSYRSTKHAQNLIGTGPFVFKENMRNIKIILIKNLNYEHMSIEKIEYNIRQNEANLLPTLKSHPRGEAYVDIIPLLSLAALREVENFRHLKPFDSYTNSFCCIGFNYKEDFDKPHRKLISKRRFREAICQGFNRLSSFKDNIKGKGERLYGPLSSTGKGFSGFEGTMPEFDKDSAIRNLRGVLMEEDVNKLFRLRQGKLVHYNSGDDVIFKLIYDANSEDSKGVVEGFVSQIHEIGLTIKAVPVSYPKQWEEAKQNREFDLIYGTFYMDENYDFTPYFKGGESKNIFGYNENQEKPSQGWMEKVKKAKTKSFQMTALVKAHNELVKEIAAIFLWNIHYSGARREDIDTGTIENVNSYYLFQNIRNWKLP